MDVEWVVFDAVGTVMNPEPSVASAYHSIGRQFGSNRTAVDVNSRFATAFAETEQNDLANGSDLSTSAAIEEARWRHVVASVFPEIRDREGCFQALHEYFARPSAWRCFDDVAATLQTLRECGRRLAIASNFDDRLHSICDGSPPLTLFEKRYVSSELGYRKPSAKFYQELISDLGVMPERVLMVGDGLDNDVLGALGVGMHAVLISREPFGDVTVDSKNPETGSQFPVIHSLTELKGLLK
ncbi:MAG: HAD family hydrolase [Planctomycetota bacterium]|nr:HAD family hydrolase [Planctomycetota bacterium]